MPITLHIKRQVGDVHIHTHDLNIRTYIHTVHDRYGAVIPAVSVQEDPDYVD